MEDVNSQFDSFTEMEDMASEKNNSELWLEMEKWATAVLDTENELRRYTILEERVYESLDAQLADGLIDKYTHGEMKHISNLLRALIYMVTFYEMDCKSNRRRIICNLIELYDYKAVKFELLINMLFNL